VNPIPTVEINNGTNIYFGDWNGDGITDVMWYDRSTGNNQWYVDNSNPPDLISTISNGIGGTTTLEYLPSSSYDNCKDIEGKTVCLPFVTQTLASVTTNDGNGNSSTTTYDYSGGYFDYTDREYRGFEYVKSTAPNGTTTEMWFKQDSIYKGLLEEQITKDSSGNSYTRAYNTYLSTSPYAGVNFPYLSQKDDYVYDGTPTAKQATTSFTYDSYGNITRKYLHGDVSITGDERDEYIEYTYDTTNWIASLPLHTYLKDSVGNTRAQAWFTYDTKGNLLTKTSWLSGGTNPVLTYTYDPYGNVATIIDARNNTSTISYDSTYTYPATATNSLGHTVQKTYDYRFGKPLTETDPNGNITRYEYDEFGRLKKVTKPSPYGITEYKYQSYGDPYNQNVREEAKDQSGNLIHFKETYFDGLGRTTYETQGGPDAGTIIVSTVYNNKGLVWKKSYPYYSGDTAYEITYIYDAIDRPERTFNPDGTSSSISYDRARTMYIDANGHKKVAVKDIYEKIVSVEEYTGNSSATHALYATTGYQYDVLNNLTKVTDADAQGNETTMTYDTLSRKISMDDPDMGHWTYQYDANGNLTSQTDAKSQTITFTYDALNRIILKDYPTGTDITYIYDEIFSSNPKGRLTTLTDNSGTTGFYYDSMGQITKMVKTIASDQSTYTTQTQYDPLGRVKKIIYPDTSEIDYTYDGNGNVKDIKSGAQTYATYNSYNALGNPLLITYGNGVTTTYQYHSENNRLFTITTNKQTTGLMNLSYYYDWAGNITKIQDHLDGTKTRSYAYDDLDRLIEADSQSYGGKLLYQYDKIGNMTYNCKYGYYFYDDPEHVHAVTKIRKADGTLIDSYSYDANGNMISGANRMLTYDYDNRPVSIIYGNNAVVNVYDASGNRVQKMISAPSQNITKYIGQLYECDENGCTKYIFAGTRRMAQEKGGETYYYHTDHLESSSVMTDTNGVNVEQMFYYPYGEMTGFHTGTINVKHKFSGHEYDGETGLYYMGARYYDPKLARFISADTIVPLPFYPQSLNRYAFTLNNPIVLRELNGNCFAGFAPSYTPPSSSHSGGPTGNTTGPATTPVSTGQSNAKNNNTQTTNTVTGLNGDTKSSDSATSGAMDNGGGGGETPGSKQDNPAVNNQNAAKGLNVNEGSISTEEVGNIVFNETRSLSGEGIDDARKDIAHTIFNADSAYGNKRDAVAGTAPKTADVPTAEKGIYDKSQQAAQNAHNEKSRGIDPTGGATNFNFRNNNSRSAFQGLSISTQHGPFNNSFPTKTLNATGIYSNTYGGKKR
ncbi:MAG: hypothetical protein C4560_09415, partial [Nitrospiraceae bacterium]